jgi:hypothetical protein
VNQSEDIVALGYRVLEKTVEEIKSGYKEAVEFNSKQREFEKKQRAFEKGKGPKPVPPTIPWEQMVERMQSFQNMALDAMRDGSEIIFDSIRSATKSTQGLARTWEKSRDDIDTTPVLAGPVFEDPVEMSAYQEHEPSPVILPIRHRGLTRLRIHAVVDPKPVEIPRPKHGPPTELGAPVQVSFEPSGPSEPYDDATSLLSIHVGQIPASQKPGLYEGFIRASNFELLIARLRIRVRATGHGDQPGGPQALSHMSELRSGRTADDPW